jgi:hypothetical protein
MKKLLVICAIFGAFHSAQAQPSGMYPGKWEENDNSHKKIATVGLNEFENTRMDFNGHMVTFTGLPELKKPVFAVITNSTGEFIRQRKINEIENDIKVDGLPQGLYFITIVYRQKGKRAFTVNIE